MSKISPVLIITMNRFEHFKKCIESLSFCTLAEDTDLFIFIDYPLTESHWEGYYKIKAYLPQINGFKSINIVERDRNFGAIENTLKSMEYIFKMYDRLIYLEDDNILSKTFLEFLNEGLEKFENNSNILAICGYKFPFEIPKEFQYNYFYSKGFSAWGFGTWREKDITKNWNNDMRRKIIKYLYNPFNAFKLNSYQYGLLEGLISVVKFNKFAGDRLYCFNNILNGTYSVFPTVSKVRNSGHDGTGQHCSKIDAEKNIFNSQIIDNNEYKEFSTHFEYENRLINNTFKLHNLEYLNLKFHHKIKLFKKYFSFILKHLIKLMIKYFNKT